MRVVRRTISDHTLRKHRLVLINQLNLAADIEFVHNAALTGPNLLPTPISATVALCAGRRRYLENVYCTLLHQSDFEFVHLVPDVSSLYHFFLQ